MRKIILLLAFAGIMVCFAKAQENKHQNKNNQFTGDQTHKHFAGLNQNIPDRISNKLTAKGLVWKWDTIIT